MRLLAVLAVLLLAAGCAGDDDAAPAPATTAASAATGCTPATSDLMTPLANKLTLDDARLTNGQLFESAEHEDVYFVAAEIDSLYLPSSGDVGVWATKNPHGGDAIYSVNDLARQSSDWRGAETIGVSADDDGAVEARACVFR